jgi:hypothetical protein
MSATERARALGEQCAAIKSQQEHLLGQLQSVLADATQVRLRRRTHDVGVCWGAAVADPPAAPDSVGTAGSISEYFYA